MYNHLKFNVFRPVKPIPSKYALCLNCIWPNAIKSSSEPPRITFCPTQSPHKITYSRMTYRLEIDVDTAGSGALPFKLYTSTYKLHNTNA